jgi:hypothetical protein
MAIAARGAAMKILLRFLAACALVACGGSDPGGASSTQGDGGAGTDGGAETMDGGGSSDATAPPNEPVVPGTPVSNPTNAFSGEGPYMSDPPTIRANDQHGGAIVTGKDCLSCHNGTTCMKFDFAGTVWFAPDYTSGAADVEVRIIDANDLAYSVHSDVDGNFWHRADTSLAMPALSGVRTADFHETGHLNGPSCNSCHFAGNTSPNAPPGPPLFVDP